MSYDLKLDWHETRNGNHVTSHPETGETVTVFQNKAGNWSGVWGGVFISGFFDTHEDACEKMERWFDGEDVKTWKPTFSW
jgi:hypothetical protein